MVMGLHRAALATLGWSFAIGSAGADAQEALPASGDDHIVVTARKKAPMVQTTPRQFGAELGVKF